MTRTEEIIQSMSVDDELHGGTGAVAVIRYKRPDSHIYPIQGGQGRFDGETVESAKTFGAGAVIQTVLLLVLFAALGFGVEWNEHTVRAEIVVTLEKALDEHVNGASSAMAHSHNCEPLTYTLRNLKVDIGAKRNNPTGKASVKPEKLDAMRKALAMRRDRAKTRLDFVLGQFKSKAPMGHDIKGGFYVFTDFRLSKNQCQDLWTAVLEAETVKVLIEKVK